MLLYSLTCRAESKEYLVRTAVSGANALILTSCRFPRTEPEVGLIFVRSETALKKSFRQLKHSFDTISFKISRILIPSNSTVKLSDILPCLRSFLQTSPSESNLKTAQRGSGLSFKKFCPRSVLLQLHFLCSLLRGSVLSLSLWLSRAATAPIPVAVGDGDVRVAARLRTMPKMSRDY